MGLWSEMKAQARKDLGVPEGRSAVGWMASLFPGAVKYMREEKVSAAYSARRTKGLQSIANYQFMGGDSRERIERARGGKLPKDYFETREAARKALRDFPEVRDWLAPGALD